LAAGDNAAGNLDGFERGLAELIPQIGDLRVFPAVDRYDALRLIL